MIEIFFLVGFVIGAYIGAGVALAFTYAFDVDYDIEAIMRGEASAGADTFVEHARLRVVATWLWLLFRQWQARRFYTE